MSEDAQPITYYVPDGAKRKLEEFFRNAFRSLTNRRDDSPQVGNLIPGTNIIDQGVPEQYAANYSGGARVPGTQDHAYTGFGDYFAPGTADNTGSRGIEDQMMLYGLERARNEPRGGLNRYGYPDQGFDNGYAKGGNVGSFASFGDATVPRYVKGPGTGTSDSIPARLSNGEFVFTAQAVRNAGNGNPAAGAQRLYRQMRSLERMTRAR